MLNNYFDTQTHLLADIKSWNRADKMNFVQRLIDFVRKEHKFGSKLSCSASKIVAGLEPNKTNELLQMLAFCIGQSSKQLKLKSLEQKSITSAPNKTTYFDLKQNSNNNRPTTTTRQDSSVSFSKKTNQNKSSPKSSPRDSLSSQTNFAEILSTNLRKTNQTFVTSENNKSISLPPSQRASLSEVSRSSGNSSNKINDSETTNNPLNNLQIQLDLFVHQLDVLKQPQGSIVESLGAMRSDLIRRRLELNNKSS